ncbi:MAG TPA: NAD(P)H-binding protein [Gemmatimonadaceae bacterium]|nr:NAD(P)H-binding protein [Gemmatimonadaceae bacterium]
MSGIAPAPEMESPLIADSGRSVLVLGGTGLVGSECLRLLIEDPSCERIVVLARRPLTANVSSAKVEVHVIDFNHLTSYSHLFDVDQILCALGTTRKQTPSKRVYRSIDFLYPITAAHLGLENGASHFLLVSAVGADSGSWIFYNRLKGELEDALKELAYRSLTIVQPSVLVGDRAQPRRSERIAAGLSFVMPEKYKPVLASTVAKILVDAARRDEPGIRVIANREIEALGSSEK